MKTVVVDGKAATVTRKEVEGRPVPTVRVPISSTSQDRDGDNFTDKGLDDQLEQLKSGRVPMFLDHGRAPGDFMPSYNVLDMQGKWVDGEVEDGLLYGEAELDGGDFRAQELLRKLEAGLPIGFSVGFIVRESKNRKDDEGRTVGEEFEKVDLLEVSAVGIPSNPDAVTGAIPVLAKQLGMTTQALAKRLGIEAEDTHTKEDNDMDTEEQIKELEQKVASLPDDIKKAVDEAVKSATEKAFGDDLEQRIADAIEAKMDDDDDEEHDESKEDDEDDEEGKQDDEDEDEDDDEKSSPKGQRKRPEPRGMVTAGQGDDTEGKEAAAASAKEVRPFQHA